MNKGAIVLAHVSDIHFSKKKADGASEQNSDIRSQLLRDIETLIPKVGSFTGVVATGDIAFSAKEDEYVQAKEWLSELCSRIKCDEENVWLVPGNHDIDREAVRSSSVLQDIQRTIRTATAEKVDELISKYVIEEKLLPDLLYGPLKNYIAFSSLYSCDHKPNQPIWIDELKLNDGSVLRLLGLNSTLVSNSHDDSGANKLVLGRAQLQLSATPGIEYLILCHHPPQWLVDQDLVESLLKQRVRLQLFGHKHVQVCEEIDRRSVRITAGAMHPDKREPNWCPRYNVISLIVTGVDENRHLEVTVFPRVWDSQAHHFKPDVDRDSRDSRTYQLKLDKWVAPAMSAAEPIANPNPIETSKTSDSLINSRRLTYRFLSLPFTRQIEIAQKLGLFEESDKGLQDAELFRRFFTRAREGKKLTQLEQETERAHDKK